MCIDKSCNFIRQEACILFADFPCLCIHISLFSSGINYLLDSVVSVLPTEGIRFHVLIHFCNCTRNVEFNYHSFNLLEIYQLSVIFLVTVNLLFIV